MTKLLVEQVYSGVDLTLLMTYHLNKRLNVAGFYPYIYMHGSPAGTFTIQIQKDGAGIVFLQSFTCADIKAALNTTRDHAHVFMPIIPVEPFLLERGTYRVYLYAEDDYTYLRNSFLGWIRQHENLNNELSYEPSNDGENPLAYRLKVFKEETMQTIEFADGFTSDTDPSLEGLGNEAFPLLDNQAAAVEVPGLNFSGCSTVFAVCEIQIKNDTYIYRQAVELIFLFNENDSTWSYTTGPFEGDDLLKDTLVNPQDIIITIDDGGQVFYQTGNMGGTGNDNKLKMNLNRISTT